MYTLKMLRDLKCLNTFCEEIDYSLFGESEEIIYQIKIFY